MDRKKTILIAVLINAGLVAVLFIAALSTQEESPTTSKEMVQSTLTATQINPPLFSEPIAPREEPPLAVATAVATPPLPPSLPKEELPLLEKPAEKPEPIAHKLPLLETPTSAPKREISSPFFEITVKKGDTLEKIAKQHHTTAEEIMKLNKLSNSFLRIYQVLRIPKPGTQELPESILSPMVPTRPEYYIVKVGDNPWTIAVRHHMKVEELLKLNRLTEENARKLKPGDRLRIR